MRKAENKGSGNNLINPDMIFIDEKVIILHNNEMFESFNYSLYLLYIM